MESQRMARARLQLGALQLGVQEKGKKGDSKGKGDLTLATPSNDGIENIIPRVPPARPTLSQPQVPRP
jgi:hypothetical protein